MKVKKREVLGSCGMNDEERTSHAMNHGTKMTAAELAPLYGMVIASSAFNLSMQVLRYLTFPPCGSPLPLSASDGVEHSRVQGHALGGGTAFVVCRRVLVCFEMHNLVCTSACG